MAEKIFIYLASGASIGATFSMLPSPLLALMINETLKYGREEGIKIALVPSMTDLPIIAVSAMIMYQFEKLNILFGLISVAGFLFLGNLGLKSFRSHGIRTDDPDVMPQSIRKGIITNLLNPNPYIFWFTVGTPMIIRGWKITPVASVAYILGFFATLIGIRVILTLLINRSKKFLNSSGYILLSRFLAIVLILLAFRLLWQGINLIKG